MSLVTTCPSCGTSFRVTPEQLSAHRGDVRCGHCQHIFSALKQLEEITPPPTSLPQETPHEHEPIVQEPATLPETTRAAQEPEVEPSEPTSEPQVEIEEDALPEVEELHLDTEALDFEIDLPEATSSPATEESRETPPITEEIEITSQSAWPEEQPLPEAPESPSQAIPEIPVAPQPIAAEEHAPETREQAKRRVPNWAWALISLLLILTALGQSLYFLRNNIASRYPQTGPLLESLCKPLGCGIELPRQADLLNIEDSDLKDDPEHEGVLILVSVLDNRASFTQAFPLLELTLTDTFDHPVLRRTFTPQEYLPAGTSPARGLAAGAQVPIRLYLSTEDIKPAGYRLYVKY